LEILSDLSASPDVPGPPKLKNIDEEMRDVAQSELFDAAVSSLKSLTIRIRSWLRQRLCCTYQRTISRLFMSNWLGGDLFDSSLD